MLKVGITGGLASGKTLVAKMFKQRGAVVLDADRIAHRTLYKNGQCYKAIIKVFGKTILNANKSINRKKLAGLAFHNSESQKHLCSIIHPEMLGLIRKKLVKHKRQKKTKISVVDAALLIETGLYKEMDKVILIKSTKQQQIERAVKEKNISLEQVRLRMRFQLPSNKKIKYSDYVIDNQNSITSVRAQVSQIWKDLKV